MSEETTANLDLTHMIFQAWWWGSIYDSNKYSRDSLSALAPTPANKTSAAQKQLRFWRLLFTMTGN